MEIPNKISKDIDITEEKSKLDASCKKLLSFKIILAHILKYCVEEFNNFEVNEIAEKYIEGEPIISEVSVHQDETDDKKITGINVENTSVLEKTVRYDILFNAFAPVLNETIKLIINIEAQNNFSPGYPLLKRAVYYCARLISAQYKKEFDDSSYKDIKKVFSIWICTSAPKNKQNTITRFSFNQQNLSGKAEYCKGDYDLMEIIMICLSEEEEYGVKSEGLIKFLNILLSSKIKAAEKKNILENEYNIKMTKAIEREMMGMCNISDGIYEKGIKEGIKEGKLITMIKMIKMCREFGVSLVDTIKRISEDFDLSEQEAEIEVRKRWE